MAQRLHDAKLSGTVSINGQELKAGAADIDRAAESIRVEVQAASGANQDVTFQLIDGNGDDVNEVYLMDVVLFTDAEGTALQAVAPNGNITATVGSLVRLTLPGILVVTDEFGAATLRFNNLLGLSTYNAFVGVASPRRIIINQTELSVPLA